MCCNRSFSRSDKRAEVAESVSSCALLPPSQYTIKMNQWEDRQILPRTNVESMALELLLEFKNDLTEAKDEIAKLVHEKKEIEGELLRLQFCCDSMKKF